jgi:hypothetical protein
MPIDHPHLAPDLHLRGSGNGLHCSGFPSPRPLRLLCGGAGPYLGSRHHSPNTIPLNHV